MSIKKISHKRIKAPTLTAMIYKKIITPSYYFIVYFFKFSAYIDNY